MFGRTAASRHWTEFVVGISPSAAKRVDTAECAAMAVDGVGRIRGCNAAAEELFGASQFRLVGRRVSEFIADLFLGGSSPSYGARYLGYLCAEREWRKFEATDTGGRAFAVELTLNRMAMDGQEIFLVGLRRPAVAACR